MGRFLPLLALCFAALNCSQPEFPIWIPVPLPYFPSLPENKSISPVDQASPILMYPNDSV